MDNLEILVGVLSVAGKPIYADGKYDGPYTVIPKAFQNQTLETENLMMTSDVLVTEIPYSEVSNISGLTITIGGH